MLAVLDGALTNRSRKVAERVVNNTNERFPQHQESPRRGTFPASSEAYSGDEVFTIPVGMLGLLALLMSMMLLFQP